MAQLAVQPIVDKARIAGGQVLFRPKGSAKHVKLGSVVSGEFTPNITEVPVYNGESGARLLTGKYATMKEGSFVATIESFTEFTWQALFMSEKAYVVQSAATDVELPIEDIAVGDVVRIPGINPTDVAISDGEEVDPVVLVEDTHYTVHRTGFVEIIALPEGFATDGVLTYSLPAVTEADKLLDLGIMSTNGVRGELTVLSTVSDGNPGIETDATWWDVEFKPSGAVPFINTESQHQATITGSVFAVAGKGTTKAYGQFRGQEAA